MSFLQFCKHVYLTRFSKPECDRALYRSIKRAGVKSIVEIGVGDLSRSKRMLKFAAEINAEEESKIQYTGIDMFEGRDDDTGVALKEAHRSLGQFGQTIKLVPGDPFSALARSANGLLNTDLIVVSADQDRDSIDRAWFYLPRMMHETTLVYMEVAETEEDEAAMELLTMEDIKVMSRSQDSTVRRAA